MGSDRRQGGGQDTCCSGQEETLLDEIPTVIACPHDAALRSRAMTAPGLPPDRAYHPAASTPADRADLVRLDVEFAREPCVFFGVDPRDARELLRAAADRLGCRLQQAFAGRRNRLPPVPPRARAPEARSPPSPGPP